MRTDLTIIQVQALMAHLHDALGDYADEQLVADTLEGETDAFELISKLLNGIERDEGDVAALIRQIEDRNDRKARAEKRIKARRETVMAIMDCAGLDKLQLPEASLSVRSLKDKLQIVDEAAVPDDFQVVKRSPDKKAINAVYENADDLPNWLTRETGGSSLTIRRR